MHYTINKTILFIYVYDKIYFSKLFFNYLYKYKIKNLLAQKIYEYINIKY